MKTQKPKILAIIPARSGSQGIKNKNIKLFNGKPLIYYTIAEAKKSKLLDRIIVSTDSEKYAKIAKAYGAEVPFLRPKELAKADSLIAGVIVHLLKELEKREKYRPDYIVLLQPTSPLRVVDDIDKSLSLALSKECDGVVSVCATEQFLYSIEDGFLKLLHKKEWIRATNRQALPSTYRLDGCTVYVIKRGSFLKNKSFIKGRILAYIIERWRAIDLDNEDDFILAELVHKHRHTFLKRKKRL